MEFVLAKGRSEKKLQSLVLFVTFKQKILYLDGEIAKEASMEVRTKGYQVQLNYKPVSDEEMQRKKDSISKTIFSKHKMKDE